MDTDLRPMIVELIALDSEIAFAVQERDSLQNAAVPFEDYPAVYGPAMATVKEADDKISRLNDKKIDMEKKINAKLKPLGQYLNNDEYSGEGYYASFDV